MRDKRKALVEGEWGPKLDQLVAAVGTPPLERVAALLMYRRQARDARVTIALAQRIDEVLLKAATPELLQAKTPSDVPTRLNALLALFDQARSTAAPLAVLEACAAAFSKSLAVGFPPVTGPAGVERLSMLLQLRDDVRTRQFPPAVDQALTPELQKLATASFEPATPATALARYDVTVKLRNRARALGAPDVAIALADRAHDDALTQVLAMASAEMAAHRYVPAFDLLLPWANQVDASHPLRAKLTQVQTEGGAWHASEAAKLPSGYRKLMHLSFESTLRSGGSRPPVQAERQALAPTWQSSFTLKPTLAVSQACSAAADGVVRALGKGSRELAVQLELSACQVRDTNSVRSQSRAYVTEEKYYEQIQVQVGTRYERVQTGSHKEQCSKASSLEGYVWQGVCDVPDYENKAVPIYETREIEKRRDVERSLSFPITKRSVRVDVGGVVSLTWEDGSALKVPFSSTRTDEAETFRYEVPGRRLEDRGTIEQQGLPPGFGPASTTSAVAAMAGAEASTQVHTAVRALRAKVAREAGAKALQVGDEAAAGEAFVRSVLHDSKAEGDAAAWFTKQFGVSAEVAGAVLSANGVGRSLPAALPVPTAVAYAPKPLEAKSDDFAAQAQSLERDVGGVTTATYQSGLMPPNEFVDGHVGVVPFENGGGLGSRVAVAAAFDFHYSPLEMIGLRYGFALYDQLGIRFSIGMMASGRRTYDDGKKEGPLALTIDAGYAAHIGLRLPYVSVFAGAGAGYMHTAGGDSLAYGFHVEPSVRLGLRLFRTKQLIVEATGLVPLIPGVAHKDRAAISFPILGSEGIDLKLSVERTLLPSSQLSADGVTRLPTELKPVFMAGVQVGARL
ncbi:MAG: hypothetical protein JNG84_15335 [Archangium sp.]|nr:hypothetical protein [Archangium sp.]